MQLPVELLLMICHFLSPDERKSLSCTCRAMFAFINTKAPFRILKLTNSGFSELNSLYRYSRVLAFANEVHWNSKSKKRRGRYLHQRLDYSRSINAARPPSPPDIVLSSVIRNPSLESVPLTSADNIIDSNPQGTGTQPIHFCSEHR